MKHNIYNVEFHRTCHTHFRSLITIERRKKDFNEETYIFLDSFFQTKLIGKLDLSSLEAKERPDFLRRGSVCSNIRPFERAIVSILLLYC